MTPTDTDCFTRLTRAHHSCEANGQNPTAGPHVQGLGPLVQLVVQELESVGMLGGGGRQILNQGRSSTSKVCFKTILPCVER